MFDPENPAQIQKLNEALKGSYRKLASFRKARHDLVKDYVGGCYGDEKVDMPANLLAQMVDIYVMQLAGRNPQVILPTSRTDILPFIADLEAVINQELDDMRFDKTLRRWVQEAIFSIGILKCGMVDGDYVEVLPGQPQPTQDYFADIVDLDDFVFDTTAYEWQRVLFVADKYRMDYEKAMEADFDDKGKANLRETEAWIGEGDGRASDIGIDDRGGDFDQDDGIGKTTWVWDVCLPEDGLIITMAQAETVSYPLKVVEWDGPTTMPYHILSFNDVPGNIMPLSPGMVVKSLNRTMNALYRKLVNQAKRQKTVGFYRIGNEDDAEAVARAEDGKLIGVEHPDVVNEFSFGGPSAENLAFSMQIQDMFSRIAGNLDAMGGLGPQSDTYRQDAMIQATVSQKAAKMQVAVVDATVDVIKDMAYRIWHDPIRTYTARRTIPKTDVEVAVEMPPELREGSFHDFGIKVEPYSMQYRSPRDRSNELMQIMTTLVLPMLPALQSQGVNVNLQRLFEYLSKYMTLPELNQILEYSGPQLPGTEDKPRMPNETKRTYERVSRPGATAQGNSQTMQQILMGGNPQASERAALSRPTGV